MGDQADSLADMIKFSDNEGKIIWPAWRAELARREAFEFGDIGNAVIEGTLLEKDINAGDYATKHQPILNALISRSRAGVQMRSEWLVERLRQPAGAVEVAGMHPLTKMMHEISMMGQMSMRSALRKIKSSFFLSIERHGLDEESKTFKDFQKLKLKPACSSTG